MPRASSRRAKTEGESNSGGQRKSSHPSIRLGEYQGDDRVGVAMAETVFGLQPADDFHVLHPSPVSRELQPVLDRPAVLLLDGREVGGRALGLLTRLLSLPLSSRDLYTDRPLKLTQPEVRAPEATCPLFPHTRSRDLPIWKRHYRREIDFFCSNLVHLSMYRRDEHHNQG
jgi:hypothetical protein